MIQPFFDYACNTWYLNLNKNLKMRLEAAQNTCIRFCLKLGDRKSITVKEFEKINWLPIHKRINQCILSCIYKFHAKKHPIIWMKFFTMQSAMEFLHITLIKSKSSLIAKQIKVWELYHTLVPHYGITKISPRKHLPL